MHWSQLLSVLWCCRLGGRKGIWPVKTEWWGVGVIICLEQGADLHMAQLMPLPLTVSCFNKIQIGFTFLVRAHPGSPGRGPLNGCLFVCFEVNRTICKQSAPCFTHISVWTPHHSIFTGCIFFLMPNQQCQNTGRIYFMYLNNCTLKTAAQSAQCTYLL